MRVLLIKLKHLGDTLLLTPTIRFLKERFPGIEIDVIVRSSCEAILESNPDVSRVLTVARPESDRRTWRSGLLENLRLIRTIIGTGYDFALTSHHQVMRDFETVTRIMGVTGDAGPLTFHPSVDEADLIRRFPWACASQPYAVIHPTSRWSFKEWLPEHWAAVADGLAALGLQVVFTGGPDALERETIAKIQSHARISHISVAGQVSVHEFGYILKRAGLFLGIDTFAMHLAAAMQTPSVALFGPSLVPAWTPWKNRAEVIAGPCHCNPSTHRECARPHTVCMASITAASVLEAAVQLTDPNSNISHPN